MGQALLIVKHPVTDFSQWRAGYESVEGLRQEYGITAASVAQNPADANDVTVLHWFPTLEQAQGFCNDARLGDAMKAAGVAGPPRIEIVTEA